MPTPLHASLLPLIEGNAFCVGQMSPHITDDILSAKVEASNEFGRILGHIIASRNGLTTFLVSPISSPLFLP